MAKHFFNSILFNMADTRLVMCLYEWPWTFHPYVSVWMQPKNWTFWSFQHLIGYLP